MFYLSVFIFFIGLPFILSSALGYKFNRHTFKFIKTGLIFIKTQPEGAKIYLNDKLLVDKSPASIHELVPGVYKVALELEQHYPWKGEIDVEAGKVSRLDKIILFPLKPDLRQLNRERFSSFRIDAEKKMIYYLDQTNKSVYRSDFQAEKFEDIASLPQDITQITGWEISPDRKKLFLFNDRQLSLIFFDNQLDYGYPDLPVVLDYAQEKINNVFWHSDNYHLVVLTDKHVQAVEARPQAKPVDLVELSYEGPDAFYDVKEDTLYFSDNQDLYRLELNSDLFLLERLMVQPLKIVNPEKGKSLDE